MSGLDLFFKICGHIVRCHVPPSVSCLFSASQFLALNKQFGSMCSIVINEMTYLLIVRTLVIQLRDTFAKHFTYH